MSKAMRATAGLTLGAGATADSDAGAGNRGRRQPSSGAQSACLAAANRQYGGKVGTVNVVSSEFSQANSSVRVAAVGVRGSTQTDRRPVALLVALALGLGPGLGLGLASGAARAEADGPDYYSVRGVAKGDVLNIRAEPDAQAPKVGEIPPHGTCIRNLGCRGGLSLAEFTALSPAQQERRQRENPRWCKVEYQGMTGWVAGRYLAEGDCRR